MAYIQKIPFRDLLNSANELVKNLESRNMRIPGGCSILQSLGCLKQMLEAHEGKTEIPQDQFKIVLRNGIGLAYLSYLLNNALNNNLISNVEPHLKKLFKDQPLFHYHYPRGFGRDQVFELLVASGLAPNVSDLSMSQSDTGEADLKFGFGGEEWCAECKILYEGSDPDNEADLLGKIRKTLKKGIKQIEATGRKGIIILGLTQRINHDAAFPEKGKIIGAFKSVEKAIDWYHRDLRRVMSEIGVATMFDQTVIELVNYMKKNNYTRTKAMFGFFHSVCSVTQETLIICRKPRIPITLAMVEYTKLAEDDQKTFLLAQHLNDSFQKAMW